MGQFSMEISGHAGSVLSGNQQAASRDIEQAYQTDAHLGGLDCTDGLQDRYKQVIERGVDRELEYLAEEVRNRQRRYQ